MTFTQNSKTVRIESKPITKEEKEKGNPIFDENGDFLYRYCKKCQSDSCDIDNCCQCGFNFESNKIKEKGVCRWV